MKTTLVPLPPPVLFAGAAGLAVSGGVCRGGIMHN